MKGPKGEQLVDNGNLPTYSDLTAAVKASLVSSVAGPAQRTTRSFVGTDPLMICDPGLHHDRVP